MQANAWILGALMAPFLAHHPAWAQGVRKEATTFTTQANAAVLKELDFADKRDFEDARRGFIAPLLNGGVIRNDKGGLVYDAKEFTFPLDQPAPPTVNPSLWRQSQLVGISGLFKVTEGVYQVRSTDISHVSFIESNTGVIVVDTLITMEAARAALALYQKHRPGRPVKAVIYTHSHVDHFGGVRGIVNEADVKAGKVRIIAPDKFTGEAISENVYAGNAMARRSVYSYGRLLPRDAQGTIGAGLGTGGTIGTVTLILPTDLITKPEQRMTIDGLDFEFLLTPGTEAPAEMHFYVPKYKALCTAENATHTLHNFYTLRGAKTRDVAAWVGYLNRTLDKWGSKAEVLFAPHTWPVFGNERVVDHIEKYRDTFRYIHDRSLHLANQGYTMDEIGEMVVLPPALARNWATRGYYGSVSHNARAVYNFYLGYFSGNPADLHRHTPVGLGQRYVKAMGGAQAVIKLAREAYDQGDYRWSAELLKHVVYADPANSEARNLQADAFEQMGYQSENATWRGFYLSGAQDLREGVKKSGQIGGDETADIARAMPAAMMLDFLAIQLDSPRAAGADIAINLEFTDVKEKYGVTLKHGVLNHRRTLAAKPHAAIALTTAEFGAIVAGKAKLDDLARSAKVKVRGDGAKLGEMLAFMGGFDVWFNVVTPNGPPKK